MDATKQTWGRATALELFAAFGYLLLAGEAFFRDPAYHGTLNEILKWMRFFCGGATLFSLLALLMTSHAHAHRLYQALLTNWRLWLVCVYLAVACLWSEYRGYSLARYDDILFATAVGVHIWLRHSSWERRQVYLLLFTFMVTSSVVLAVTTPYGQVAGVTDQEVIHEGSWRGIYYHKNTLGVHAGLAAAFFLLITRLGPGIKPLGLVMTAGASLLILKSNSASSLVALLANGAFQLGMHIRQKWRLIGTLGIALSPLLLLFGWNLLPPDLYTRFVEALGRSETLTGRLDVWLVLLTFIEEKPWLGWGFRGFWVDTADSRIAQTPHLEQMKSLLGWEVAHGHNGYLDVVLETGLVGLAVILLCLLPDLFLAIRKAIKSDPRIPPFEREWPAVFFVHFLLCNLTESQIINERGMMNWAMYVAVALSLPTRERIQIAEEEEERTAIIELKKLARQ